jgi:hypothetical protein
MPWPIVTDAASRAVPRIGKVARVNVGRIPLGMETRRSQAASATPSLLKASDAFQLSE